MTYQEQFNASANEIIQVAKQLHTGDPDKLAEWLVSIAYQIKETAINQAYAIRIAEIKNDK